MKFANLTNAIFGLEKQVAQEKWIFTSYLIIFYVFDDTDRKFESREIWSAPPLTVCYFRNKRKFPTKSACKWDKTFHDPKVEVYNTLILKLKCRSSKFYAAYKGKSISYRRSDLRKKAHCAKGCNRRRSLPTVSRSTFCIPVLRKIQPFTRTKTHKRWTVQANINLCISPNLYLLTTKTETT